MKNGIVFTVRKMKSIRDPPRKEKDWATHKRTGKKIANIKVQNIGSYHSNNLLGSLCDYDWVYFDHEGIGDPVSKQSMMLEFSGFDSYDGWKEALRETYGKALKDSTQYFRIYKVTIPGHRKITRNELRMMKARHRREIEDLQENCDHPLSFQMPVCVEQGVWGEALFCTKCGKQLEWVEEPKKTHEVEYIPVEWIK